MLFGTHQHVLVLDSLYVIISFRAAQVGSAPDVWFRHRAEESQFSSIVFNLIVSEHYTLWVRRVVSVSHTANVCILRVFTADSMGYTTVKRNPLDFAE